MISGMGKRRSVAERRRLIEEHRASGMTRREFCEQHQIPLTTLDSWKRAERNPSKPRLLAVNIEDDHAGSKTQASAGFALNLANGRRIESGWNFAEADLIRVIRVVENA
jgi:transposase-like protein